MEIVNLQNELIHGWSHLQPFLQSARARSGNPQQQRAAALLLRHVISQRLQVESEAHKAEALESVEHSSLNPFLIWVGFFSKV